MQKYENERKVKTKLIGRITTCVIVDSYLNQVATRSKKAGWIYLLRAKKLKGIHYFEKHHDQVVLV